MTDPFAMLYSIYDEDRDAIRAVCPDAKIDQPFPHGQTVPLGTVRELDEDKAVYYEVDILVDMLPAHFWKFRVRPGTSDGKPCEVTTGSGSFTDYWPAIEQIATGMLVVRYPSTETPQ